MTQQLDIDAIHKALANPVRRQILAWLKERTEVAEPAGVPLLRNQISVS